MRFVAMANVQGNAVALRAVLQDIDDDSQAPEYVVCVGDVVGRGPQPNEVLSALRERKAEVVLGNYDDAVAYERLSSGQDFLDSREEADDARALAWTRSALTPENMAYLRDLPRDIRLFNMPGGVRSQKNAQEQNSREYQRAFFRRSLLGGLHRERKAPGRRVLVMHGTPRALNEAVREDTATSILQIVARDLQADVVVGGQAGTSFVRRVDRVTFIGAGTVSGIADGVASYSVVNLGETVDVDVRTVEYDGGEYAWAVHNSGLPHSFAALRS